MIVLENKERATARQVLDILCGRRINHQSFICHSRAGCTPTATVTLPSVSATATGPVASALLRRRQLRRRGRGLAGEGPAPMSEKWSQLGAKLWDEAQPGPSTLAEVYLNGRGIRLAPWPAVLRFHPAADHPKLKQKNSPPSPRPALVVKAEEPGCSKPGEFTRRPHLSIG